MTKHIIHHLNERYELTISENYYQIEIVPFDILAKVEGKIFIPWAQRQNHDFLMKKNKNPLILEP